MNNQQMDPKTQMALVVSFPIAFIGFGLIMLLSEMQPIYHSEIRPDSQGMWKVNIRDGETEYCEVKINEQKLPVEGQCIPVKTQSS